MTADDIATFQMGIHSALAASPITSTRQLQLKWLSSNEVKPRLQTPETCIQKEGSQKEGDHAQSEIFREKAAKLHLESERKSFSGRKNQRKIAKSAS